MKAVLLVLQLQEKKSKLVLSSLLQGDNGKEQHSVGGKVDLMFLNLSIRLYLEN